MSADDNTQHLPTPPDSSQNRRKHPCILCQQRKVKCDRNYPCANCIKARVECVSASAIPPKRRKKRFPEAELLARLRRYEEHLKGYGADIEAINREEGPPKISPSTKPIPVGEAPRELARSLSVRRSLRHVENTLWSGVNEEFLDAQEILQGSSDEDEFEAPITKTYDSMPADTSDMLFPGPIPDSIFHLHPSPVQIFRLWQTFLDNVNPLLKIFHAPTVQQQILDAIADLSKVSKRMEVLLFGIYVTAIMSLSDAECQAIFAEEKSALLTQYQSGCRHALLRAGFLRSSDLTILQGFVLYLLSCLNFSIDPRALYCLSGIAIRIAQRMGLNFDGTNYGLRPFELEMRRRLWWQVLLLDSRVGELSGAGPSIQLHVWNTKQPLNVNDSDLFPDMRDPPVEHPGATEMLFVLIRCEITELIRHARLNTPTNLKDKDIDEFEQVLEMKYLKYCDAQVPLHYLSSFMAKSAFCRLRMRIGSPHIMTRVTELSDTEKDSIFLLSLSMIQCHHLLMGAAVVQKFLWFISTAFPFPAHVHLLCALRHRQRDELSNRAWKLLAESFERRSNSTFSKRKSKGSNSLRMALSNLTIKAWEASSAREGPHPNDRTLPTPGFIAQLREELASRRNLTPPQDNSPPEQIDVYGDQLGGPYQWLEQPTVDHGQSFDPIMSGVMPTDSSMVEFWNDLMQAPNFENSVPQGYYQ